MSKLNTYRSDFSETSTQSTGLRIDKIRKHRRMSRKFTLAWRFGVLLLLAATVQWSFHYYENALHVGTETMLNVSVSIKTISHVKEDEVGDTVWRSSTGSGFLISQSDCEVLTNHHVVADAAHVEVFPREWPNARGITATVLNSNPRYDIAILKMANCDRLPQAQLGDSNLVSSGDEVYAVGNPLGSNPDSISRGIVSHLKRFNPMGIPYLQTDANINHGNSGGALFNRNGEVIGINTAILATSRGNKFGIAYSLPINLAREQLSQLRDGEPSWGDAGIDDLLSGLTPDEAALFNVPDGLGAVIVTESPNKGPGVKKLLRRDLIYAINGEHIVSVDMAKRKINSYRPGETVLLGLIRNGEAIEVGIKLVDGWEASETPQADYYEGYLGLTLEMWEDEKAGKKFDTPVITKVKSLGPAHMAHIASSQKTRISMGPKVFPVQLDVKTITGVVAGGKYVPLTTIEELEELAYDAYKNEKPLLMEIEVWAREMPMKFSAPLKRQRVSFHRILPEMAVLSDMPEMLVQR